MNRKGWLMIRKMTQIAQVGSRSPYNAAVTSVDARFAPTSVAASCNLLIWGD